MRRLVIAAAVGAAVVGTAVPSLASQTSTPKQQLPVGVQVSTTNGVFVGTTINGQPGVGVVVANGHACVGMSYEIPLCADLPPVAINPPPAPAAKPAAPSQSLPGGGVVVYHDDTRTAVGVGEVGVIVYNDGTICPVVST
ncbi:MAG: hypothetical protein QOD07_2982, partial [Frankiaceae bacterium]|nr:hypothetical protein [Frankiaceae bacterium]